MTGLTRPITRAVTRPVTRGLTEPFGRKPLNAQLSFWLPLMDLGAGQVNTTPAWARGDATATFTRATTAWTKLASGLWAQVSSGVARSGYVGADTAVGAYGGYLVEEQRTNECLQSRDFTQAAWTKSTMTAAKDQVGIDGVAASASSLLATGANATVKQTIASASAVARRFSVFVKRITGTGNIDLTLDNGTTWTTISASINSATFTRVGAGQTLANPTVGIRIVTSGDKIAVDMAQEEVGTFDTSPMPTAAATVTRNADVLSYPYVGNMDSTVGGAYVETYTAVTPSLTRVITADGSGAPLLVGASFDTQIYDGVTDKSSGSVGARSHLDKRATSWGGGVESAFTNGTGASAAFDGDLGHNLNAIELGTARGGGTAWNGFLKNARLWNRALTSSDLAALTG